MSTVPMVSMVSGSAFEWCLCHGSLVSTVSMVSMVSGSAFLSVSWFPGIYSAHGVYGVW